MRTLTIQLMWHLSWKYLVFQNISYWAEQTFSSCYTQCYHLDSNSSISVACVDIPIRVYIKCIFSVACVDIPIRVYIKCIFAVACVDIPIRVYIKCIFAVSVYPIVSSCRVTALLPHTLVYNDISAILFTLFLLILQPSIEISEALSNFTFL